MNIEKFENPVVEVEEIETKDIITSSPGDNDTKYPADEWGFRK